MFYDEKTRDPVLKLTHANFIKEAAVLSRTAHPRSIYPEVCGADFHAQITLRLQCLLLSPNRAVLNAIGVLKANQIIFDSLVRTSFV